MSEDQTLYDQLGGKEAIEKLIHTFYETVVDDKKIGRFFQGKDVGKIRSMQVEFFSAALGGPVEYTGGELATVHSGLGITRNDFSHYAQLLLRTLEDLGVDETKRSKVIDRINLYADDIIGRGGMDG